MTKEKFIEMIRAMYRVGNASDSDSDEREPWTHPDMAGEACCQLLDDMLARLRHCGVLTSSEVARIYDLL